MVLFRNGHFQNVVSTFSNVVKLHVENDNVVSMLSYVVHVNIEIHNVGSTLFDVVNSNVETHNVVSTLIWGCPTSRRRINKKTTLKQRWNVCWDTVLRKPFLSTGMELHIHEIFKPSLCRYSTRLQMALGIALWKTNTGQKSLSLLGPKIWSKINPRIKNVKTSSSFMHALKKHNLLHL